MTTNLEKAEDHYLKHHNGHECARGHCLVALMDFAKALDSEASQEGTSAGVSCGCRVDMNGRYYCLAHMPEKQEHIMDATPRECACDAAGKCKYHGSISPTPAIEAVEELEVDGQFGFSYGSVVDKINELVRLCTKLSQRK